MAKRREFQVITDFNTRHEMIRKETPSMREALREASSRAKRGITAHVVERGARTSQSYVAVCRPDTAIYPKTKGIAKCFLWGKHKKALKANYRGAKRRRARLRKQFGV